MSDLTSTDQLAAEQDGKPIPYEPDKQGARTLAHMLHKETFFGVEPTAVELHGSECYDRAERILGTTGLFIPDVTKHEPIAAYGTNVSCICGWSAADAERGESYFDHIGAAQ